MSHLPSLFHTTPCQTQSLAPFLSSHANARIQTRAHPAIQNPRSAGFPRGEMDVAFTLEPLKLFNIRHVTLILKIPLATFSLSWSLLPSCLAYCLLETSATLLVERFSPQVSPSPPPVDAPSALPGPRQPLLEEGRNSEHRHLKTTLPFNIQSGPTVSVSNDVFSLLQKLPTTLSVKTCFTTEVNSNITRSGHPSHTSQDKLGRWFQGAAATASVVSVSLARPVAPRISAAHGAPERLIPSKCLGRVLTLEA